MRLVIALVLAAVVSLLLFFAMHSMVSGPAELNNERRDSTFLDFVRLKQDSQTQTKERRKKEPPKPKKPQLPQTAVSQQNVDMQKLPVSMPDVALDLELSNQSFLGDATVGMGFGDSDVIPLVRQNPVYPEKAKRRKIEGYVTARLAINPEGTVDDVEIIDAQPRGVFEREARRALFRYKFKPKMEDGKPVGQIATQTIEFNLGGQ
jgi:protein TonB